MILTVGTIIIIEKDFTENGEKYKSRVVDIQGNKVMIDYPTEIKTGKTAYFMNGIQLYITFVDEYKRSFAFKTDVMGRSNDRVPMLQLTYPGDEELIKIQRREFVRVETPIDVAILTEDSKRQLVAEDISAGGMAINLPEGIDYNESEMLEMFIVLPFLQQDTQYIRIEGQVVRIWETNGKRIMSVRFEEVNDGDRQQIVRFCFERQVQMRKDTL